jgi:hypothetical protein
MPNLEHVALLDERTDFWNAWRKDSEPSNQIDLSNQLGQFLLRIAEVLCPLHRLDRNHEALS